MEKRRKIAILGGGMGALSAAWTITQQPDWQQSFEVTVYQRGWRLGGKAAGGRNMQRYGRVEEHGQHVWSGSYTNALEMMRDCYAALADLGLRAPEAPLGTFGRAFKALNHLFVPDRLPGSGDGSVEPWRINAEPRGLATPPNDPAVFVLHTAQMLESLLRQAGGQGLGTDPQAQLPAVRDWLQAQGTLAQAPTARQRRILTVIDLGTAALAGMMADEVAAKGFDQLDQWDSRNWLAQHGASHESLASGIMAAAEGFAFGYPGSHRTTAGIGAGTFLHNLCRTAFAAREALFFQMQAGAGDTVFAPLYQVLKARGVQFRFFHAVTGLEPDGCGKTIASIGMVRQAEPLCDYDPLVTVRNLACWPSEPLWDQLRDGEHQQHDAPCFEDELCPPAGEPLTLHAGVDFDQVILGIGIGALPEITPQLANASPTWAAMLGRVQTAVVRTAQIWLTVPSAEYGWKQLVDAANPDAPSGSRPLQTLAAGLPSKSGSFSTWTDASHLIARADWGDDDRPWSIAAFTGIEPEPPDMADGFDTLRQWLEEGMAYLWPHMRTQNGGFLFSALHDPEGRSGPGRLSWQFVQTSGHGSQRQTLTTPGSLGYRLPPDGSGFGNLYLAGDWTLNSLNAPSAEAAAISGIMAARVLIAQT